jgi:hypothetical protein
VAHKPAGRGNPRTRANRARTADQWLQLPGWRRPLDAVFVFALVAGIAWLVLVTIPAAANRGPDAVLADESTSTTSADEREPAPDDPGTSDEWVAGPLYTGAPPPPEPPAVVPVADSTARPAVAGVSSRGAARVTPSRTTARTTPRTSAPAATTPAVAPSDTPSVAAGTTPVVETSTPTETITTTEPTDTSTPTDTTTPTTTTSSETTPPTETSTATPAP